MSPLELVVGFLVAASLIAVITAILRRRSGRQDLLGTQVREMEARTAAAASPAADDRLREAATQIAASRAPNLVDAPPDAGFPDATAPPDGWLSAPDGENDAMVDAFAWLRIAALVEAGQREQAVELLSTTMTISTGEAEMLVDGLNDAGSDRRPG